LVSAFESRLRQLQSRAGKPAFQPRFVSEAHAQQRGAVLDILRAHAEPFHDAAYPDVTIVAAWHGTDSSILPSIMSTSFANLATTDSGFFGSMRAPARRAAAGIPHADRPAGKGIYTSLDAECARLSPALSAVAPHPLRIAPHPLPRRYAHRCYASFNHATQRERDTGALVMCCVSLFSAYPVIGRSDMDKLQGRGNYQNYDAHIVPVVPADSSNPRELNYFPCEEPALLHPYTGSCV
jgi:hypothetical protein